MSPRHKLIAACSLSIGLVWVGSRNASSQVAGKQTLVIGYPNPSIQIGGGTKYAGLIYVRVYPSGADSQSGSKAMPIATAELAPSQRDVMQLPVGEYEVHFQMRNGSELNTFIHRNVILRADRASNLVVEMNGEAKTTVIGGDMTAQQMADTIRKLQTELAAARQELAELKKR